MNANAKWQALSHKAFFDLGLIQSQQIPQPFYLHSEDELVLVVAKAVDDINFSEKRMIMHPNLLWISKKIRAWYCLFRTGPDEIFRAQFETSR